jgi:cytochrome c2
MLAIRRRPGEGGLTGRNLLDAAGRAAAARGFPCSAGAPAAGGAGYRVWTEAALDAYLGSPEDFARGSASTFVGRPDRSGRVDVIAYLAAARDCRAEE